MQKIWYSILGYWSCFGWMFKELIKAFVENYPDLKFWELPTHPDDLAWYAERINGRIAMLTVVIVLYVEFCTHESIWRTVGLS